MNKNEHTLLPDFHYTHNNPYHDRLSEFSDFVMRDEEAEQNPGNWNKDVFKRDGILNAEIGTGYGHFMMEYCENHPDENFVGLDYRFKRSFALAKKLAATENKNFRYLRARGERIGYIFGENELDNLYYFFPDPWPKARHHKKRLFQMPFLENAHRVLKNGGHLYVKTDHDGYGEWMEEIIDNQNLFECVMRSKDLRNEFPDHFLSSFKTKFEKIFVEKGIKIKAFELICRK